MSKFLELPLYFNTMEEASTIIGPDNINIRVLEDYYNIDINTRGSKIMIESTADKKIIQAITSIIDEFIKVYVYEKNITERDVIYAIKLYERKNLESLTELYRNKSFVARTVNGKEVFAKTLNQKYYVNSIDRNSLVFGIGPAGTGKTYLAVLKGINLLRQGKYKKIILTRPAVEAGEKLGFLPGDLKEKIDPYLRPLYDALHDVLGMETTNKLIDKGVIEIAPLAYMRGRTLDDAYVILDEAQNTTEQQMKMFLTRLGFHSKMIVTGDISQIDLPSGTRSGLKLAVNILKGIKNIEIVYFESVDVIRHTLVQKIIQRYDEINK